VARSVCSLRTAARFRNSKFIDKRPRLDNDTSERQY
jgi:hypothetical protein